MKILKIIALVVCCFTFVNLQAQYKGGSGDGYDMAKLVINAESNYFELTNNILSKNDILQIANYQPSTDYTIDIINASGKVIYPKIENKTLISVTKTLPSGLYFLRMTDSEGKQVEKFIKL